MLGQIVQEVQCALDLVFKVFSSRWGHAAASRRSKANRFPSSVTDGAQNSSHFLGP